MPDTKITALTALTAADPANDVLPIVDVSDPTMAASGTTKKISINNVLGCSGTATLASATITGDLTVDTSTLKVDSANNRVGIGTASPNSTLEVAGSIRTTSSTGSATASIGVFDYVAGTTTRLVSYGANTTTAGAFQFVGLSSNASVGDIRYAIDATGIHTWQNVGGVAGTAMTLNSTGLGVGGSPAARIHAIDSSGVCALFSRAAAPAAALAAVTIQAPVSSGFSSNPVLNFWFQNAGISNPASECLAIRTSSADRMYFDAAGNVISNVTGTAPTLAANSQMVFNLTSNTNLRISVRGTDGTTRVANITLA